MSIPSSALPPPGGTPIGKSPVTNAGAPPAPNRTSRPQIVTRSDWPGCRTTSTRKPPRCRAVRHPRRLIVGECRRHVELRAEGAAVGVTNRPCTSCRTRRGRRVHRVVCRVGTPTAPPAETRERRTTDPRREACAAPRSESSVTREAASARMGSGGEQPSISDSCHRTRVRPGLSDERGPISRVSRPKRLRGIRTGPGWEPGFPNVRQL